MAPPEYTLTATWPDGPKTNPVDWRNTGSGVDERAGQAGHAHGVGAVPHREGQAVPGDQLGGRGLAVGRQGDHLDPGLGEAARRRLRRPAQADPAECRQAAIRRLSGIQLRPSGGPVTFQPAPSMALTSLRIAAGRARPQAASSSWEVALFRRTMWSRSPIIPLASLTVKLTVIDFFSSGAMPFI